MPGQPATRRPHPISQDAAGGMLIDEALDDDQLRTEQTDHPGRDHGAR